MRLYLFFSGLGTLFFFVAVLFLFRCALFFFVLFVILLLLPFLGRRLLCSIILFKHQRTIYVMKHNRRLNSMRKRKGVH